MRDGTLLHPNLPVMNPNLCGKPLGLHRYPDARDAEDAIRKIDGRELDGRTMVSAHESWCCQLPHPRVPVATEAQWVVLVDPAATLFLYVSPISN